MEKDSWWPNQKTSSKPPFVWSDFFKKDIFFVQKTKTAPFFQAYATHSPLEKRMPRQKLCNSHLYFRCWIPIWSNPWISGDPMMWVFWTGISSIHQFRWWCCSTNLENPTGSIPSKIEWDLPNGPRSVSCDRAIRYSGSGVRSVGPVGDFFDLYKNMIQYVDSCSIPRNGHCTVMSSRVCSRHFEATCP